MSDKQQRPSGGMLGKIVKVSNSPISLVQISVSVKDTADGVILTSRQGARWLAAELTAAADAAEKGGAK